MKLSGEREISAAELAERISVSERHAVSLLKDRVIAGRQLRSGVWLTSEASLERYLATAHRGRGRALNQDTAWGLLWELSGKRPTWLTSSTLARVRQQIETLRPEELVQVVSGRTRAHYYADSRRDVSSESFIRTGRRAAGSIGVRVYDKARIVSGYVRHGSIAENAKRMGLREDYEGTNTLFENTLPMPYDRPSMPKAVIAVDLAVTGNTYERKRALKALVDLRTAWRAAR